MLGAALGWACADEPTPARVVDATLSPPSADMLPLRDAGDAEVPDGGLDQAVPDAGPDQGPACDPSPERCNGVDDDCDTIIDEGYDIGAPCTIGIGECQATAVLTCTDDGDISCPVVEGAPVDETCDGRDEDCDGVADEDFDGDGDGAPICPTNPCVADCPPGEEERCRALCDAQDCRDENLGVFPGARDVCGDGIDQNCDGRDAPCTLATGRFGLLAVAAADDLACPDGNGDGSGDNAMALLGGIANSALEEQVAALGLNLFMTAAGLAPPGLDGAFELGVISATHADGVFIADPTGLDMDGRPSIRFADARVREGAVRAGPGRFALALPVAGLNLELVLFDAVIRGQLAIDPDFGLSLAGGLVWGAVRDVDLQATLDGLEQACEDEEPRPSFCDPLMQFRPIISNVLRVDQDTDGDGEFDAYSVCLRVNAAPADLVGVE
ncbi:MAG: hypothetical protein ACI9U2_004573 [Bradymonadia bacterium]|jgi:hypothetical protein